ncbi:MAG: 30S ribosomal protein S24e [Candidatus Thorarchaeota archaeon]|nr:30S ribosomal protein S24e [Candidatus Thorarchaeota archaeon]MCK5240724.1 30S ribosomal protein S24e [Candidatus Thorarchaeota archaeon]
MKIEILKETENKTLARKEVEFKIDHQGGTTPSRADVRDKIVAQYDASASTVVVRSLDTKFGVGISKGIARIYNDEDQMKRVELNHILKRHESKKSEGE